MKTKIELIEAKINGLLASELCTFTTSSNDLYGKGYRDALTACLEIIETETPSDNEGAEFWKSCIIKTIGARFEYATIEGIISNADEYLKAYNKRFK